MDVTTNKIYPEASYPAEISRNIGIDSTNILGGLRGRKVVISVLLAAILLAVLLLPQPADAMTGSGTEADPYIIYNVTDLQAMNDHLGAYYELGNDIDASATSGWNGGDGFVPVGKFTGHFDGNSHKITILGTAINCDFL